MDENNYVFESNERGVSDHIGSDWVNLSAMDEHLRPEVLNIPEAQNPQDAELISKHKPSVKSPVLLFQLCLCLVILIVLFLSKSFLPEYFGIAKEYFDSFLNSSMISDGDFSKLDYSKFFPSTFDEA